MQLVAMDTHCCDLKLLRSAQRNRSLLKDREVYERLHSKRETAQNECKQSYRNGTLASYRLARPHRAARAVARSWLAKGEVQDESDMPAVSIGHVYMHKPTVLRLRASPLLPSKAQPECCDDISDADTVVPDDSVGDCRSEMTSPTLSFMQDDADMGHILSEDPLTFEDSLTWPPLSLLGERVVVQYHAEKEAVISEAPVPNHQCKSESSEAPCNPEVEATPASESAQELTEIGIALIPVESVPDACTASRPHGTVRETCNTTRREDILREVVIKLRDQTRKVEQQAEQAKAWSREVEQKEAAQNQKKEALARKQALQMEKQKAAQLRKERSAASHAQAVEEKADRALKEALAIREQAKNDASISAHEASLVAQQQAEALIQAELLSTKVEAEALKLDGMEVVMQAERVKAFAVAEAYALKAQAARDQAFASATKAQAEAMSAEAECAAQLTRENAMQDAAALKARAFSQLLQKVEIENQARQEAEACLVREANPLVELPKGRSAKQATSAKQGTSAALKLAKAMERQCACKVRKQAKQERRQEQEKCTELETRRVQAVEEHMARKKQAFVEVAAMKAKAHSDEQASQARALEAAREEAEEAAQKETANVRVEAEMLAETIKAKAAKDAADMLREAQANMEALMASALESTLPVEVSVVDEAGAVTGPAVVEESDEDADWVVL